MTRPPSIVNFERCYLGALAVGVLNSALNWQHTMAMPGVQEMQTTIGSWYVPLTRALAFLIPLVLWYFAARRASVVAKWIVVALFVLGVLTLIAGLAVGGLPAGVATVLSIVSFALNAIAVWLLFRPDARAWFGERRGDVA